jgi:hypothetical protein
LQTENKIIFHTLTAELEYGSITAGKILSSMLWNIFRADTEEKKYLAVFGAENAANSQLH